MLEKWGYYNISGFDGTSWGGNCLDEVVDIDLDIGNSASLGWSDYNNDRECLIEGRTIIEDIEQEPRNPIDVTYEITSSLYTAIDLEWLDLGLLPEDSGMLDDY